MSAAFGGGKKPSKPVGKTSVKHSLKEYFDEIDARVMNEAEQLTIEPAKQNTQVIRQGTKTLGTVSNPQLAAQIKQSIGKGEMTLSGDELGEGSDEKWIQKAVKHPGAFTAKAKAAGKSVAAFAKEKEHAPGKLGKQARLAMTLKKMHEAEMNEADLPPQDGLMGAGLGAGRSQGVTEAARPDFPDIDNDGNRKESISKAAEDKKKKTKVKESMDNKLKAAHHRGKAHALSKESYNCKYDDMEEARMYHEGYKEGLDECYGQVPIRGLVTQEAGTQGTIDDMASFGARDEVTENVASGYSSDMQARIKIATPQQLAQMAQELAGGPAQYQSELKMLQQAQAELRGKIDEVSKGEWLKQQAKKPGDTFKAFGQTFHDKDVLETEMAFESWDNQLNSLLEEYDNIQEGMTVSISKGQQGSPDSVSVTAQDGEADKLLALVKSAGLGLFGDEIQADVGAPVGAHQHGGVDVVGDHDGMMALMKKMSGGDAPGTLEPADGSDYKDEEGHDEGGLDLIKQFAQKLQGKEKHDEATCNECGMMETDCGCDHSEKVDEVESEDQQEYQVAEDNPPDNGAEEFEAMDAEIAADNDGASSHGGAENSNIEEETEADAEASADEGEAELDSGEQDLDEEELDESYANADDDTFEADIDFMTKVISGGLNKQKSTGQTTIPVIAGQDDRMGYSVNESAITDWKKLAGI